METKKILVIDDNPHNVASAHEVLSGYNYRVIDNVKEAYETLSSGSSGERFDIVLTDLFMPRGEFVGAMKGQDTAETMIPAGLVFAIRAANNGSRVIICTDSNHHQDRICSLLDLVNEKGASQQDKPISFVEARDCNMPGTEATKNWLEAMQQSNLL